MQFMASLGDIQGGLHCVMPRQAEILQKYYQVTNILLISLLHACALVMTQHALQSLARSNAHMVKSLANALGP